MRTQTPTHASRFEGLAHAGVLHCHGTLLIAAIRSWFLRTMASRARGKLGQPRSTANSAAPQFVKVITVQDT